MSLHQFWTDEGGATSIEYALLGAMFVILAALAWTAAGSAIADSYNETSEKITEATSS